MNRAVLAFLLMLSTVLLTMLKFIGLPDLSWWWVTAPLWVPLTLALLIAVLLFIYALIVTIHGNRQSNKPHQIG